MTGLIPFLRNHGVFLRRLGLVFLLLLAFTLRVWNLDWDQGTHQHPDERYWSIVTADIEWEDPINYFDSRNSEMNPYQYQDTWVYGTLPLFATKAAAEFFEKDWVLSKNLVSLADKLGIDLVTTRIDINGNSVNEKSFNSGYEVQLIGRLLSALLDTGTVFLIYLLGKALFNRIVGALSSILLTFTPLHLQYSHFHGAEVWATFFVTAIVLLSIYLYRFKSLPSANAPPFYKGTLPRVFLIGVLIGLATASKFTAVLSCVVPLTVFGILYLKRNLQVPMGRGRINSLAEALSLVSTMGLSAIFTFRIFQPYAFDGLGKLSQSFMSDLDYLEAVNTGGNYPWVVQWVGRTTLLYPFESIFWSGMGPALTIAVCVGLVLATIEIIRNENFVLLAPLSFLAVMVGLVTQQFNPLIRYLLPMYPTAIVFGGYGIYRLYLYGTSNCHDGRVARLTSRFTVIGAGSILFLSIVWGVAFINGVYNSTNPRIHASSWINENIDPGSQLTSQLWDDSLPIRSEFVDPTKYERVQLDLFRPDGWVDPETGVTKPELLLEQLDQSDYVIEASNRLYDAIPRMPAKYPATSAYYRSLFSGDLGFNLVATFENKPSLFGINLPSPGSEETFSVYDHPTVMIWEKTPNWDVNKARAILNPFAAARAPNIEPRSGGWNALMLRPEINEELQDGSTFNERFSTNGFFGSFSWLWWFLWLQLAAFLVLPWSLSLFDSLKDKGYGLSKILGFGSVGLLSWLLVSWDIASFGRLTCIFSLLILGIVGIVSGYKRRKDLIQLAIVNRKVWAVTELVFVIVFFSVLFLRSMNPDLWESYRGGEKPMELGYLTSIGRSNDLPPYDPWFAGGAMNYYYFGWFLLAVPMLAIGVLPEIAFQLGVATFVALAVMGVWTLAINLIKGNLQKVTEGSPNHRSPFFFGLLAVSFFGIFGTWDAVRRHHQRFREANTWNALSDWPFIGSVVEFVGGFWEWVNRASVQAFDWWSPSRVNSGNFDITEFPFFTFLFGDLHPHLMGMAFFGLLLCASFAYVLTCQNGKRKSAYLLAGLIGAVLGIVRMTNTWDFPTLSLISLAGFLYGTSTFKVNSSVGTESGSHGRSGLWVIIGLSVFVSAIGSGNEWVALFALIVSLIACGSLFAKPVPRFRLLFLLHHGLIAVCTHLILVYPFTRNNQTFGLGLHRSRWVSPFSDFLSHWGIFLGIAFAYFLTLFLINQEKRGDGIESSMHVYRTISPLLIRRVVLFLCLGMTSLLGVLIGWAFAVAVLGAITALSFILIELRLSSFQISRIASLSLFVFGFMVIAGPEVITINNDVARMNTVFKFWLQGWILFSVASAFAVSEIWIYARQRMMRQRRLFYYPSPRFWLIIMTCILFIGLVYPLSSIGPRLDDRFSTNPKGLNGIAYLDENPILVRYDNGVEAPPTLISISEDLPMIQWLRKSIAGSPTIVEWTGDSYDWNSRISIHTGLPSVLGWSSHQRQQRLGYQNIISQRKREVQDFYRIPDHNFTTSFLLAYNVKYVIVGSQERRFGTEEALSSLDTHPGLHIVFEDAASKVYSVTHAALWALIEEESLASK